MCQFFSFSMDSDGNIYHLRPEVSSLTEVAGHRIFSRDPGGYDPDSHGNIGDVFNLPDQHPWARDNKPVGTFEVAVYEPRCNWFYHNNEESIRNWVKENAPMLIVDHLPGEWAGEWEKYLSIAGAFANTLKLDELSPLFLLNTELYRSEVAEAVKRINPEDIPNLSTNALLSVYRSSKCIPPGVTDEQKTEFITEVDFRVNSSLKDLADAIYLTSDRRMDIARGKVVYGRRAPIGIRCAVTSKLSETELEDLLATTRLSWHVICQAKACLRHIDWMREQSVAAQSRREGD